MYTRPHWFLAPAAAPAPYSLECNPIKVCTRCEVKKALHQSMPHQLFHIHQAATRPAWPGTHAAEKTGILLGIILTSSPYKLGLRKGKLKVAKHYTCGQFDGREIFLATSSCQMFSAFGNKKNTTI